MKKLVALAGAFLAGLLVGVLGPLANRYEFHVTTADKVPMLYRCDRLTGKGWVSLGGVVNWVPIAEAPALEKSPK